MLGGFSLKNCWNNLANTIQAKDHQFTTKTKPKLQLTLFFRSVECWRSIFFSRSLITSNVFPLRLHLSFVFISQSLLSEDTIHRMEERQPTSREKE